MSTHPHHHHGVENLGDGRLLLAIAVNVLLTVGQIVGGIISGSLSLVADALHNLNDAASLGIALGARRIARRPADAHRTFGYRRAEVIGTLINVTFLILVGFYLLYEAIVRYFNPEPIQGWIVMAVAGVALVVDLATALLTYSMSKGSMNVRAAFVHNVADALGSLAVILAGTLILLFDLYIADLVATLLIAGYILWQGFAMMGDSIHILMESVPSDIDLDGLMEAIDDLEGVRDIHHVHVWELDEHHRAMEAHITVENIDIEQIEVIKSRIKQRLAEQFRIHHSTLEFEHLNHELNHECPHPPCEPADHTHR